MTAEAPEKKRRKKTAEPVEQHEHEKRKDDRPAHLAPTVLANYFAQNQIEFGVTYGGGRITQGSAVCINGGEASSLWRVTCFSEFDSEHGPKYLPTPTACVRVDDKGAITEVVSDKEVKRPWGSLQGPGLREKRAGVCAHTVPPPPRHQEKVSCKEVLV